MKHLPFIFFLSLIFISCNSQEITKVPPQDEAKFQNGDIIFHTSTSSQSEAIQIATNSKYSHVGIVFQDKGAWFVIEAIQPVSITSLDQWIARGKDGVYSVKRLKDNTALNANVMDKMRTYGQSLLGISYDSYFEWSDDKIYCSELVWKMYAETANIELCPLKTFKDYDFDNAVVKAKLKERFGDALPMNELVVSPDDIFQSELLVKVE